MSGRKRRSGGGQRPPPRIPLTAGAAALLPGGSDTRLRQLVYDLFTVSIRMQLVRDALARRMNVTGPQYSVLMAVGELQGDAGVTVGVVAQHMHVTGAHATIEIGKLVRRGLLSKVTNPRDGRSVLVRLTPRGHALIDEIAPLLRATNDRFFGELDRKKFLAAGIIAGHLVTGSEKAVRWWDTHAAGDPARAGVGASGSRVTRRAQKDSRRPAAAASNASDR